MREDRTPPRSKKVRKKKNERNKEKERGGEYKKYIFYNERKGRIMESRVIVPEAFPSLPPNCII